MAVPILNFWKKYFNKPDEGLGSSYERLILNNFLLKITKNFKVQTVLEAPSFGFTGVSGINSMALAKNNLDVTLVDHDLERTELIEEVWKKQDLPVTIKFLENYSFLPYRTNSIDFSWNFSALWFVENLEDFLKELCRITDKVILLAVPNRAGIGFLTQKFSGKKDMKKYLKEENILPINIKKIMKKNNWKLIDSDFIDCPPWPDIGMPKNDFLKKFGLSFLAKEDTEPKEISILNYYNNSEPDFEKEILKFSWFEKKAPWIVKKFWAHHRFFLFVKK